MLPLLAACGGSLGQNATVAAPSAATLAVTPTTIDFGTTATNGSAVERVVRVTNVSSGTLMLQHVSITPASVFHVQNWVKAITLSPGESFDLHLAFAPASLGSYSGTVTFSSITRPSQTSASQATMEFVSAVRTGRESSASPIPLYSFVNVSIFGKGANNNSGGGKDSGGGSTPVSVRPGSATLRAGQTMQFTANQAVTWNATLGTISSSGLYRAPQLASQSVDRVAAVALDDTGNYATASIVVKAAGSTVTAGAYAIDNPPPPTWFPFSDSGSLTNKPLPPDVMQHCWGNTADCSAGDTIAQWTMTSGYGAMDFSRHGMTVGSVYFPNTLPSGNSADLSGAVYYGQASDPWYKISGCHAHNIDVRFHAPNRAVFAGVPGGDQGIDIYDVAQGLLIQAYGFNSNPGMIMPDASSCPGNGPSSCAVVIPNVGGCSAQQVGVDSDLEGQTYRTATIGGNTYTLGGTGATGIFSGWAGMLRQNELMNGTVNHALLLGIVCAKPGSYPYQSDYVWPARSGILKCSNDSPAEPKAGALLFCDYTPTQIASMLSAGQISKPQATLLKTFCTYGAYVAQTGGPASGSTWQGMRLAASQAYEGQTSYQLYYNYDNGFESWACSNGMNDFGQTGCSGGTVTRPYGPSLDVLGGLPRLTGPGGTDLSGRSCSVAPGCDVSGHIHVADSCVAKAMAGVSGGCQ